MVLVGAGNRLSGVGASQVAAIGVPPVVESDGFMYHVWYGANVNGRLAYHPAVAQPSETLEDTLARVQDATNGFPAHTATYGCLPNMAIVQCGRNNMTFTPVTDVTSRLQTYESILDYLLGLGILPVVTELAVSDTTTQMRNTALYNMGLSLMARKKGLPFIQINDLIVDSTTGGMQDTYSLEAVGSGLHLSEQGAKLVGERIAAKLLDGAVAMPWAPELAYANDGNTDDAYLLTNMLMLADTGGQPTNWTKGGADSANLTTTAPSASSDGVLGDWMKNVKTTTAGSATQTSSSIGVTAGNWLAVGWADKWVYTSGTPTITTNFRTTQPTNLVYKKVGAVENLAVNRNFMIVKVPAGATNCQFVISMDAVGEYYIGQVTVMDLTANGLDSWI